MRKVLSQRPIISQAMELMGRELVRVLHEKSRPEAHPQKRWDQRAHLWTEHVEHLEALHDAWGKASNEELAAAPTACHLVLVLGLEWSLAPMEMIRWPPSRAGDLDAGAVCNEVIKLASMGAQWSRWPDLNQVMQGGTKLASALPSWAKAANCKHDPEGYRSLDTALDAFESMLESPLGVEPGFWGAGGGFGLNGPMLVDFYGSAICRRMLSENRDLPPKSLAEILSVHAESARQGAGVWSRVNTGRLRHSLDQSVFGQFSEEMREAFNLCGKRPDHQELLNNLANQFGSQDVPEGEAEQQGFWMAWAEKLDFAAESMLASQRLQSASGPKRI